MRSVSLLAVAIVIGLTKQGAAEESFVTIQKVEENRILISNSARRGGRRSRAGIAGNAPQRRPVRNQAASSQATILPVPATVKITTARRERRTGKFRVGVVISGGLRNRIFRKMTKGLEARVVTDSKRITEINVITATSDINQSNVDISTGQAVIAIRPKRPPLKKR